jgi:hypothetical protein
MPSILNADTLIGLMLLGSCGLSACKRDKSSAPAPAVADGTYDVSKLICTSSEQSPSFPDATRKALLLQFDDLTSHTIAISSSGGIERLASADCALTIKREYFRNEGTEFSFRDTRKLEFAPPDCQMVVRFEESTYRFGSASGLFADRDKSSNEEIPFIVESLEKSYRLTSSTRPGVQELWQQYGCQANDQIQLNWTRIEQD